jgi:polyisoprenoid-binding protein YceI
MKYLKSYLALFALIGLMAGCATSPPQVTPPSTTQQPAAFPESYYRQAQSQGKMVLRIDTQQSLVSIEVRRAGTLARLGHDHVIASHDLAGYVLADEGRADLYLPLAKLTVDEPALRAAAGFDTQPTQEAIEGTRHNMLAKVLEADRYPYALIHVTRADPASSSLQVSIMLHGVTRTFEVPAQIETKRDRVTVNGRLVLKQTDFGIVPFSVLGGAIQVQDSMDLHFHIIADQR